jgi:outer membrane receptor for ferrienterochelin and colicins
MKINKTLYYLLYFFPVTLIAQEPTLDSIQKLDEVVVITGQYSKQSVKKSVYDVKVITAQEIQQNAANNLADLLNQTLNITVKPNTTSGRSEISLFGLDGQYFKILIDNVPIVSDSGTGNNVDLTQINLDNVKQIEIVEGSMAVIYGGNTVTGIINIITKKESQYRWQISPAIQEETVGDEYSWFLKGRHIQSLDVSHKLNSKFYISAYAKRNDFAGFFNDKRGKNYIEQSQDTMKYRGYDWMPKLQYNYNSIVNYTKKNIQLSYRFEYFNELVHTYSPNLSNTILITTLDRDYFTKRFINHLNFNGQLFQKIPLQIDLSYQTQKRDYQEYTYYLYTHEEDRQEIKTYQSQKSWYSKGTLSQNFKNPKWQMQWGYEATWDKGYGSAISGDIANSGDLSTSKELGSIDFFNSVEFKPSSRVLLRPGIRYSFQNLFDNQWAYSLSSKIMLNDNLEWRTVVGSSFRTPNYNELFTYVNDGTHQIYGDENLLTERSFSVFSYLKEKFNLNENIALDTKLKVGYLRVNDKIDRTIVNLSPLVYRYINIDKFKSITLTTENQIGIKNININLGATLIGSKSMLYNPDGSDISEDLDHFLYVFQLNSAVNYQIIPIDLSFALNYKYNGKEEQFIQAQTTEGDLTITKGITEPFHWLDFSIKKQFFKRQTELTIGARNLLNVKKLNTTTTASHGSEPLNTLTMGYGRSYFIKLKHQFNF